MKLLIDANNVIYASFFISTGLNQKEFSPGMVYHLFLNKILMLKRKFELKNKDIIITFDHKVLWRKKVFPHYKIRKKKLKVDTDEMYSFLFNNCSFITLRHENLEGDDWIGVLSKHYNDDIIIVSTDKDFYQCHNEHVKQYNHIKNKFIQVNNARLELLMKILSGDRGDGIPNVLSDDDVFITQKRQKPLGETKVLKIIREKKLKLFLVENNCVGNFRRNEKLISFDKIPDKLKKIILNEVNYKVKRDKMRVMAFLCNNELNKISGNMDLLLD